MASAELSRRVGKVIGSPPLRELDDRQRREFHEALVDAGASRTCRGQAALVAAEQNGLNFGS